MPISIGMHSHHTHFLQEMRVYNVFGMLEGLTQSCIKSTNTATQWTQCCIAPSLLSTKHTAPASV